MLLEFSVNGKIITTPAICYEGDLPPGPYFVRDGLIHEAWRLYCDNLDVFEITVVPHVDTDGAKLGSHSCSEANRNLKSIAGSQSLQLYLQMVFGKMLLFQVDFMPDLRSRIH